jgi:hypothetical protein
MQADRFAGGGDGELQPAEDVAGDHRLQGPGEGDEPALEAVGARREPEAEVAPVGDRRRLEADGLDQRGIRRPPALGEPEEAELDDVSGLGRPVDLPVGGAGQGLAGAKGGLRP